MDSPDGPALFPFNALTVLIKNHAGILTGKLHQLFLCAFFGNNNMNPLFSSGTEPLLDHFPVFHLCLKHDLFWNKRRSRIKLFQEAGKHLRFCIAPRHTKIKMISSDQSAASHKEYLNNCILFPEIQAFIHGNCNDIPVFLSIGCNFLAFSDLTDTLYQIPALCRIFKSHFF